MPRHPALAAFVIATAIVIAGCLPDKKSPAPAPTPPGTPTTPAPPGQKPPPPVGPGNAHRMIAWASYEKLITFTDAQLDLWKSRGVDALVIQTRYLDELGGSEMWTGDPNQPLSGVIIEGTDVHEKQRALRDSRLVQRCHERGIQVYLGFYLSNYHNLQTPLKVWNDAAGWVQVTQLVRDIAGAAKLLGMDGLATDSEMYRDDSRQTWNWNYPGVTQTEAEVRALAKQRGRQFMEAMLAGFPNVEIINYRIEIPGSWEERVQEQVNKVQGVWNRSVFVDFWGGMADAGGFYAIYFLDPIFYKSWHIRSGWDEALQYNREGVRRTLSERWANWTYASSRFFISPFAWIDPGPSAGSFDDARPPDYVAAQLDAFHRWGEGQTFGLYTQHIDDFDYTPYVPAMQRASTPDGPSLTQTAAARELPSLDERGPAIHTQRRAVEEPRGAPRRVASLRVEHVAAGVRDATDAAFAPDGRLFIAQRDGTIRILDGRRATESRTSDDIAAGGANGLLAIALDPAFARTHYVYAIYTAASRRGDPVYRLARFREVQGTLGERAVLFETLVSVSTHASASLRFGPDDKVYAAFDGEVLRLDIDGRTPSDALRPVHAPGHALARGLDWDPATGTLWAAPASMTFYRGARLPFLRGDLLAADGDKAVISRMRLDAADATRVAAVETLFEADRGLVRALAIGPDGAIYFCLDGDVLRLVAR